MLANTARRIAHVQRLLLAPLEHPTLDEWRAAVVPALTELAGTDQAAFVMSEAGTSLAYGGSHCDPAALRAYESRYFAQDVAFHRWHERGPGSGLTAWSRPMVWPHDELRRTEFWHDFVVPYRLYDPVCVSVGAGTPEPAFMVALRSRPQGDARSADTISLLTLLHPVFEAGVTAYRSFAAHRRQLAAVVDSLADGVQLRAATGGVLHENPALTTLLARDAQRAGVRAAMQRVADAARRVARHDPGGAPAGRQPLLCEVRTGAGAYRVAAALLGEGTVGVARTVVVTVQHLDAPPPPAPAWPEGGARFRLTRREIEVARELARGRRNAEIATTLGISVHTVRRHVESILPKLGVRTRAAVAAALRGD